jgi:hypothetical protein
MKTITQNKYNEFIKELKLRISVDWNGNVDYYNDLEDKYEFLERFENEINEYANKHYTKKPQDKWNTSKIIWDIIDDLKSK